MQRGELLGIFVTAEKKGPIEERTAAELVAGLGIVGDRYATMSGGKNKQKQVSLIEVEALRGLERDYGLELMAIETRRNLLTQGVALNHLVGQTFSVGAARLRGIELCEPCGYLERTTREGVRQAMVHRGGLRAEVLSGAEIQTGDEILVALSTIDQ